MVSDKVVYWMAVGVLAIVVGNSLATRRGEWITCLGEQSLQVAQQVTDRAMAVLDRGGVLFDRTNDRLSDGQLVAVRVKTRLASMQTRLAIRQAALARLQADRVRMVTMTSRKYKVACPQVDTALDVAEPELEIVDDSQ
jgi:hypothetical protein